MATHSTPSVPAIVAFISSFVTSNPNPFSTNVIDTSFNFTRLVSWRPQSCHNGGKKRKGGTSIWRKEEAKSPSRVEGRGWAGETGVEAWRENGQRALVATGEAKAEALASDEVRLEDLQDWSQKTKHKMQVLPASLIFLKTAGARRIR